MIRFFVSSCLLGIRCRWDGLIHPVEKQLLRFPELISVCPELLGGVNYIYSGKSLISGMSVSSALLLDHDFDILSSEETDKLYV